MLRIDAHQHFWKFDPERNSRITPEMQALKKDFLPQDINPLLEKHQFDGCIAVQAGQSMKENEFLSDLAYDHDFIKGIVGWADLFSNDLEEQLDLCSIWPKIKGFRNILQDEPERSCMLDPQFIKGIQLLTKYGFTYDLLIRSDQLPYVKELIAQCPNQLFVLDHLAKPDIRNKNTLDWSKWMAEIAVFENVYCKISGMVTETDCKQWCFEDLYIYMEIVVEAFGTERIMYGSDWPVCLLAASYDKTLQIVQEYFATFTEDDQMKFFGGNAASFYQIN